jgi:hypothetical protein
VFLVRCKLDFDMLFTRNSVFKGLKKCSVDLSNMA